ncbi:hypothetical protein [Polaromonas sp. YR568]|uniref:hypothetical protein n=1 Tax=Polaromonas sp. YR568 TaxID=1855301 RepID=UPI0031381A13
MIHLNAGQPGLSYSDMKGRDLCVKPVNDAEKTMAGSRTITKNLTAAADMAVLKHLAGKA